MNLTYWDKHKVASIVIMVLVIAFYALSQALVSLEEVAWERASDTLSYDEVQSVTKYFDSFDRYISPSYYALDSLHTLIWIVIPLVAIYIGLSALYIPERYQKKEEN